MTAKILGPDVSYNAEYTQVPYLKLLQILTIHLLKSFDS
jgi:hypothetical protein